jgi:hypothetical protein
MHRPWSPGTQLLRSGHTTAHPGNNGSSSLHIVHVYSSSSSSSSSNLLVLQHRAESVPTSSAHLYSPPSGAPGHMGRWAVPHMLYPCLHVAQQPRDCWWLQVKIVLDFGREN